MVETIDTPDMAVVGKLLSNINYNINLWFFISQFVFAVVWVAFWCYIIYKIFDWYTHI